MREIFKHFEFEKEIEQLVDADRLFLIVQKFSKIDLHPIRAKIGNLEMGELFEDLIRRFNESANETPETTLPPEK